MSTAPRVLVIARTYPPERPSPLVPQVIATLTQAGCEVQRFDPDLDRHPLTGVRVEADLYLLKSGSEAALSYAGALHARGATILNPYPVAAACRDKIVSTDVLAGAGVPVPQSWLVTDPVALADLLADGPVIVKDPRGSQGRGLHVVGQPGELTGLGPGPWLAMRYHRPEGPDLKLYRIGAEVFAVERPFPARSYAEKLGRPVPVDPELRDIVLACGDAFGIEVYGVDVIRHQGRRWVVDMSSFPGFKGVPEAGRRLAAYALAHLGVSARAAS